MREFTKRVGVGGLPGSLRGADQPAGNPQNAGGLQPVQCPGNRTGAVAGCLPDGLVTWTTAPGRDRAVCEQKAAQHGEAGLFQYPGLLTFGFGTQLERLSLGKDPDPPVAVNGSEGMQIGYVLGITPETFHQAKLRRSPERGLLSPAG